MDLYVNSSEMEQVDRMLCAARRMEQSSAVAARDAFQYLSHLVNRG